MLQLPVSIQAVRRQLLLFLACTLVLSAGTLPTHAQSVADFFRGKQIRFVLGAAPGQDYDVWARFLARHLPRHVPGSPALPGLCPRHPRAPRHLGRAERAGAQTAPRLGIGRHRA